MIRTSKLGVGFDMNGNFNHAASGIWYSEWLDTVASGLTVSWLAETITKSAPSGTVCTVHYRVNDNKSDTAWSSSISGLSGRYAQVRVQFAKNEFAVSNPEVSNVVLTPEIPNMSATTNLWTYSEDLSNASWSKTNVTISADIAVAPDGTLSADKLVENTSAALHAISKPGISYTANTAYTISFYAKAAERTGLFVEMANWANWVGGQPYCTFNLATGTATPGTGTTASITAVGNGWYRCSFSMTKNGSTESLGTTFEMLNPSTTYTGDGNSGLYIWGGQSEAKPFASQYVKTAGTTASSVSSKAVMIEEGTTNLALYSQEFDNAYWTKNQSTITANAIYAPDGTLTADMVTDNTDNANHNINKSVFTSGQPGAISVYMKAGTLDYGYVSFTSASIYAIFDLRNGEVETSVGGATATIQHVGNGWYRCSLATSSVTSTNIIFGTATQTNNSYAGTGAGTVYVWGAQAEQKAYPTSYVKTTSATVTRNEETLTIPEVAINPSEGSVVFRIYNDNKLPLTGNACFLFSYHYAFSQNCFRIYKETNKNLRWYSSNAASQVTSASSSYFFDDSKKWVTIGATWSTSEINLFVDGTKVMTVTGSIYLPDNSVTHSIHVGKYGTSAYHCNVLFEDVNIFHKQLTDTEMAAYTSTGVVIPLTEKHSYKLGFDNSNFVHGEGGYRITPAATLTELDDITSGYVAWIAVTGASGSVNVDVSVDNGTTWVPVNSSGAITALENASASGKVLLLKQKFTTTTAAAIPSISDMTYRVGQKWKNSVSQYIKALFNKLTLVPTALSKWQIENKKYATSFIDSARVADVLSFSSSGVVKATSGTVIIRAYVSGEKENLLPARNFWLFSTGNSSSSANNMVAISRNNTGYYQARTSNAAGTVSTAASSIDLAEGWYTFGIRYNPSELSLWIDGVKRATTLIPAVPGSDSQYVSIGNYITGGLPWNDLIDEVHIFGESLTDSEMQTYTNLPMSSTIAINEKHTYRNKFNNDLNYGTCGVWISKWLDAGVNAVNTPWIELEYDAVTPEGTSVSFMCRTSANSDGSDPSDWSTDITTLTGRYIQIKAFLKTDNANGLTPRINSINPVAKYF